MFSGKLVLFFQHGALTTGYCTEHDSRNLQVLSAEGGYLRLPAQRVVYAQPLAGAAGWDADHILERLDAVEQQHIRIAQTLDPEVLWRGLPEKPAAYSAVELARSTFGAGAGPDHEAAVVRALQHDRIYFKFDGAAYQAHGPEQVEQARSRACQESAQRIEIEQCAQWLHAFVNGRQVSDGSVRETSCRFLRGFAVFGNAAPGVADIRSVLKQAGIECNRKVCYDLLVRLGACAPDENLLLERHGVPHTWPAAVLREAADIRGADAGDMRSDLTHLDIVSIDDPVTRDIDDAISFEYSGDTLRLGIHITDAAVMLPSGCAIDREAARRGISLYLPDGIIPMLPECISEERLSLIAGHDRAALSVFVTLGADGTVRERTLLPTRIRVRRRYSYRDVDEDIRTGGSFQRLHELLMRVRQARLDAGASGIVVPELQVSIESGNEIVLNIRERETPGQALVAECMILANHSAALFFRQHSVPVLYRTQKAGRVPPASLHEDRPLAERMRLRHAFNRVVLQTEPDVHANLGLDCYCTVTSPLRKYLDLVMQRQLAAAVQGREPLYRPDKLREIAAGLQPVLTRASLVKNERRLYWLLRSMEPLRDRSLRAVVMRRRAKTYTVLLSDFLLELSAEPPADRSLEPGCEVDVQLSEIDPFYGSVVLRIL